MSYFHAVSINTGHHSAVCLRGVNMAAGQQGELVAVVNDTDSKSNGKAYSLKISEIIIPNFSVKRLEK